MKTFVFVWWQRWLKVTKSSVWGGIVLGFFLGLAFLSAWTAWLVWPVLYTFLVHIQSCVSKRQAFLYGGVVWLVKAFVIISFLWTIIPLRNYPEMALVTQFFFVAFWWLSVCIAIGLPGFLVGIGLYSIYKYQVNILAKILTIPIIWLSGEVLGSFLYSFVTLGVGSQIEAVFSFGYVGYAMAWLPGMLMTANIFGVYSVSIIGIAMIVSVMSITRWSKQTVFTVYGFMLLLGFLWQTQLDTPQIGSVAMINTEINARFTTDTTRQTILTEAMAAANQLQPNYIILPEGAGYLDTITPGVERRQAYGFWQFTSSSSATIVDTMVTRHSSIPLALLLESLVFSATTSPKQDFKTYLTPNGEYVSYMTAWLINSFGSVVSGTPIPRYIPGPRLVVSGSTVPGVLFCYESVYPLAVRDLVKNQQRPFIAHPTSYAWFHEAPTLHYQLDRMLQIHAVWNQIPIVSAANFSLGKVYYPNGKIATPAPVTVGDGWSVQYVLFE